MNLTVYGRKNFAFPNELYTRCFEANTRCFVNPNVIISRYNATNPSKSVRRDIWITQLQGLRVIAKEEVKNLL